MAHPYCIHSRNGCIGDGTDTTPQDVDRIVEALRKDGRGHLLLYFHGGLVDKAAGMGIAERLAPMFLASAYPVFSVWESGFVEAIRNNLRELPDEPVFKNLVRKALEYALDRLGGKTGTRSIMPGGVDAAEVKRKVDAYWQDPAPERVPYRDVQPIAHPSTARDAAMLFDEAEIQADLESDAELAAALATVPDIDQSSRSALRAPGATPRDTAFSRAVSMQVAEFRGTRGIVSWIKVALLVKRILQAILRRYADGRDHGMYATVVEEVIRGVHLVGSGINEWGKALQWNRMKQDTLDAFGDDPDKHAGTALLVRLKAAIADGLPLKRITLIGHSTGAIYIAHWLDAAADMPADVDVGVVLLAPAITYELFDRTWARHGERIKNFRMFGMRDELEREDQLIGDDSTLGGGKNWKRFVYPSSLLYLVSGVLESRTKDNETVDEPDMPLLGMERYFSWSQVYGDAAFPEIANVRRWLGGAPNRIVWARSQGQLAGLNSDSVDHGQFDDDKTTLESVVSVLGGW